MNWLLNLDKEIFTFINSTISNPVFDFFLVFITDFNRTSLFQWSIIPLLMGLLWWRSKKYGLAIFSVLSVIIALNDFLGGKIVKPFFERLRPIDFEKTAENVEGFKVILRTPYHGGYSFISNHASNLFLAAVFLSFFYPKAKGPLFILAFLVALSRVYVGVHYPSDVICGAVMGSFFGWIGSRGLHRIREQLRNP